LGPPYLGPAYLGPPSLAPPNIGSLDPGSVDAGPGPAAHLGHVDLWEGFVELLFCLGLGDADGKGELGDKDLPGTVEHPLLTC
jgi:hypothetical protein